METRLGSKVDHDRDFDLIHDLAVAAFAPTPKVG